MKQMGTVLRTASYGCAIALAVIAGAVPVLLFASLPERWRRKLPIFYKMEHVVYWFLIKSWFVPLTIENGQGVPEKPVIFAANHASSIDIPLLGIMAHGMPHIWFAWSALVKYPLIGYLIKRMAILVDPTSPRKAVGALHEAVERIKDTDSSLMIFPEGQRYDDGKIHDFFRGFAILARETNRPVIPIYIENAAKVCAPRTIWINYAPLRIVVGPEFSYQEGEEDREFLERVRTWFVEQSS